QRHERLTVGQGERGLEDPDHGEGRFTDPDRSADLDGVPAREIRAEDDDVLAFVSGTEWTPGRVPVREIVPSPVRTRNVADHLVCQPDLVTQVVDHRLDLAIGDVDPAGRL